MSSAPNLSTFLASLRNHRADVSIDRLVGLLKRRQVWGARRCAVATAHVLITVVAEHKPRDVADLIDRVRSVGRRLAAAQPRELVIGNVTRRVLGLVREASEEGKKDEPAGSEPTPKKNVSIASVKEDVLDGMRELLDELDQADKQISEYATDQIHPDDTILVHGSSLTIQKFLLDAAKRRRFTVIQVEAYPNEHTAVQDTLMHGAPRSIDEPADKDVRLKRLTAAGVEVIYVPDSAIFAIMPRVRKVVLSAQGVYSNGGCNLSAGSKLVAKCARFHNVPVMVLGAIYRLSPEFPFDTESQSSAGGVAKAVSYADGEFLEHVEVVNATTDYLAPKDLSMIITNIGGFSPAFMGRIAADHYRGQDTDL